MQAVIQQASTVQEPQTSDDLLNQTLEVEGQAVSADRESIAETEEVVESQIPYSIEDVPLSTEEPEGSVEEPISEVEPEESTGESAPEEKPTAKEDVQPESTTQGGPPVPDIKTPEEAPEALPVPEPPINTDDSAALINSLGGLPATSFIAGMGKVGTLANTVQGQEQTALMESMPEIGQPTGLPVKGSTELAGYQPKKGQTPELKTKEGGKKQETPIEHKADLAPIPKQKAPKIAPPKAQEEEEESGSWWTKMFSFVSANINSIKTKDNGVNTSAGQRPKIDTNGKANPVQNDENRAVSDQTIDSEQQKADLNTTEYRGEKEIYPEIEREKLSPNVELTALQEREAQPVEEMVLTPEVKESIDTEAQAKMDAEVQPEIEKNNTEYENYQQEAVEEKENTNTQIEEENTKARQEQETKQNEAKSEVNTERENWKSENETVKQNYADKSDKEREKIDGQIDTKIEDTDKDVETKYSTAEKEADAKKIQAEKDAAAEKKKGEDKEKDRGFWGGLADAIGDFFDAIREAVNFIFDKLREGVKLLIEKAKEVVNTLIDLARDAIVGFIKAFGEVLKAFVSVALSAFPELRDKALAAIDKAVEVAVEVVNTIAEGLKKIANALLDALGAVLDAILAAYQAVFNAILDVLEFITVGIIKIIEGLTNLGFAAAEMPGQFWGQISEEFLGMDVTKPLAFEIIETQNPKTEDVVAQTGDNVDEFETYMSKGTYAQDDFKIEPVPQDFELPEALMSTIAQLKEGQELFLGENNDNTMESLLDEVSNESGGQAIEATVPIPEEGEQQQETSSIVPPKIKGDPYAEVDWFINYQNNKTDGGNIPDSADPSQAASSKSVPKDMRLIGPLSAGARLYYLKEQMMAGIAKKWEQNKWTYIGIGALVILGITALAIATGGAIFGLIPPALQIFAAIMGAAAVLKAASFFGDYIKEGWVGNLIKGGMNLARSIGILLVELIFILLFDLNTLLKVLKSGIKGSLKMAATGAKNTFKALGTGLKASGKGLVKTGGKVVTTFKGISKGIGKGAKSFDDLAKRLFKRFKFKGFKIQRKGLRFYLLGNINPWILLASGEVKKVELDDITDLGGGKRVGSVVKVGGSDAIVVGAKGTKSGKPSSFITDVLKQADEAGQFTDDALKHNKEMFETLSKTHTKNIKEGKTLTEAAEHVKMTIRGRSGVPRNPHFRKNFFKMLEDDFGLTVSENAQKFLAIHHVVPNFLKGNEAVADLLRKIGHDIDDVMNAVPLPRIDLNALDDAIKSIDDGLKGTKHLDEVRKTLKLGDDVDVAEFRRILEELDDIRSASLHAVDSYHPKFNAKVGTRMKKFVEQYKKFIKNNVDEQTALNKLKPEIDNYIYNTIDDLMEGRPKILK